MRAAYAFAAPSTDLPCVVSKAVGKPNAFMISPSLISSVISTGLSPSASLLILARSPKGTAFLSLLFFFSLSRERERDRDSPPRRLRLFFPFSRERLLSRFLRVRERDRERDLEREPASFSFCGDADLEAERD